jgi:hypothetical protein
VALGLLGAACGSSGGAKANGQVEESTTTTTIAKGADTTAAQLRSRLNGLLEEYVYLGSAASSAAIGKRPDEFVAAAAAFRGNSDAIVANVAAVFDATAGTQFGTLWRKHVEAFVNYIEGTADRDGAKTAAAVNDLNQYTRDLGTFVTSILPDLSADTVTGLAAAEVQKLKAAIDAQAAGNEADAYSNARAAVTQLGTLASTLVGATAKKNPDKIGGDPSSKAADLLTNLNGTLREHVFLVTAATGADLGGRSDEFTAASAALDANSGAVTDVITGIYGADAGSKFAPLWKKHIGLLVDYTNAVAARDQGKADVAMGSLLQYTQDFGAFISGASPKLTPDAVGQLIKTHIFTLKDVIDAEAAKNFTKAYPNIRTAADHMALISSTLATTVVAQFPKNY